MKILGLMSGTSADAVDAALVDWPDEASPLPFQLIAFREFEIELALRQRIHRLAAAEVPGPDALRELASLDVVLGERFADAALALMGEAEVDSSDVRAIASHGQTVAHHPELRATLQIGDPSVIAERTGCTVVADFRRRDLAAGGEGAPLAPFFHVAAFGSESEARGVLNLGGIANLTWIPPGGDPAGTLAFDVGPANALIDAVVELSTGGAEQIDRDGARARRGSVDAALLEELLADEFLARPPPKSTGRERYGLAEARALLARWQSRSVDDLVATLVALTCESVARAVRDFVPGSMGRLLVGGGGAANPAMMSGLAGALPNVPVERFDRAGVPAGAVEAMAFSLMGRNTLLGLPNNLPSCTGARRAVVLGVIVPGREGAL